MVRQRLATYSSAGIVEGSADIQILVNLSTGS